MSVMSVLDEGVITHTNHWKAQFTIAWLTMMEAGCSSKMTVN